MSLFLSKQLEINDLFFISDELISRKQLFQIINMGGDIQSFIIGQLQFYGSICNTKLINKLIYTEFFKPSPKHFLIFTQAFTYKPW